jgi:LysR family transcriptional activator of mexEF-oprN operon
MALRRLRAAFDDPLFLAGRQGMEPTARALAAHQRVAPALGEVHRLLFAERRFDAGAATSTFRLGMSDDLEIVHLAPILGLLIAEAPGCRLVLRPSTRRTVAALLEDGDIDVAIVAGALPSTTRVVRRRLYRETWSALLHRRRFGPGKLTMARYLAGAHAIVTSSGTARGMVDEVLEQRGLRRRVATVLSHYASLPALLAQTGAIAEAPARLATTLAAGGVLRSMALPFAAPAFDVSLAWHLRRSGDPALGWLRARLAALVGSAASELAPRKTAT